MARSVQLHPVMVILAVLAMGDLLGFVGVILAVPAAAVVTVLLDELYVKPLGAAPSPRAAELSDRGGEREESTPASRS
jgi:predicted PurR-regulated permease PerM